LRKLPLVLAASLAAIGAIYIFNASWRAAPPSDPKIGLIAHRGIHQTFSREGLDNETCTAERIDPPVHDYLENSLRSMQAAFAAGADIVELDVHPTTDGHFAVMHDWTLDCRTEGTGETRKHDLAYLKTLDIGHGYTADGGKTFPFRGKGVGQMSELGEVVAAMPEGRFLVNFKSREAREGDMLADMIAKHPNWRSAVWGAYGGDEPTVRAAERISGLNVWSRGQLKSCLVQYIAAGWTGFMPSACRLARLRDAGSEVILLGPYGAGDPGTAGIDTLDDLAKVPPQFTGYLWTNKIERIGPAVKDGGS